MGAPVLRFREVAVWEMFFFFFFGGGVLVDGVLGLGERTLDYIDYVLI